MSEVETFTFAKEVKLVDAEGTPIREGSVIRNIEDGETGVVVDVLRPGGRSTLGYLAAVGDIVILSSPGIRRVTNRYSVWVHVPREQQSYWQRYQSWFKRPFHHDEEWIKSKEEAMAMDGILALFPEDQIDWEQGDIPTCIETVLSLLANHLDDLTAKPKEP